MPEDIAHLLCNPRCLKDGVWETNSSVSLQGQEARAEEWPMMPGALGCLWGQGSAREQCSKASMLEEMGIGAGGWPEFKGVMGWWLGVPFLTCLYP